MSGLVFTVWTLLAVERLFSPFWLGASPGWRTFIPELSQD